MNRLALFLFVSLSACAITPGAYNQSAMPILPPVEAPVAEPIVGFPVPGHTPRGAGIPGERVPGQAAPEVKRSKNLRPSPREASWMAPDDAPRAAVTRLEDRKLLTSYLSDLDGIPDPDVFAVRCAEEMARDVASLPPDLMKRVTDGELDASFAQYPCLSEWLYLICAERHLPEREGQPAVDVKAALKGQRDRAKAVCGKYGDTEAVRAVLEAVKRLRSHLH